MKRNAALAAVLLLAVLIMSACAPAAPGGQTSEDLRSGGNGSSADIPDDWEVQTSAGDTTAAGIAYAPDHSDFVFAVYIDREAHRFFTSGWFFRAGGSLFEISDFVAAFTVNDRPETAYISMNAEKIDRAVIDSGTETRTIELDGSQPFALVLPRSSGSVTFYGADGQPAEVRIVR